jgi:CheY-like chemotaxis protein
MFMDMQMPVLEGYKGTRQIRHQQQELTIRQIQTHTKIIALLASTFIEQRRTTSEVDCDGFLSKPFLYQEILRILSQYLQVEYIYEPNPVSKVANSFSKASDFIFEPAASAIMPIE